MNLSQLLVIERSQHKKINREIYTCVSILLFAASPNHAGQACYGIQLYYPVGSWYLYKQQLHDMFNKHSSAVVALLLFSSSPTPSTPFLSVSSTNTSTTCIHIHSCSTTHSYICMYVYTYVKLHMKVPSHK